MIFTTERESLSENKKIRALYSHFERSSNKQRKIIAAGSHDI